MTITHCIFDLDGLLLDTEELYTKNIQKILDPFGVEYKHEWKLKVMGTNQKDAAAFLVNQAQIDVTPETLSDKLDELMAEDVRKCNLMPGALQLLEELHNRNISMCIATGSSKNSFDSKMQNHRYLLKFFNHVVCGGSDPLVKRCKPYPDIFIEAMKRFDSDIKPENVLVFEDSRNGIGGALSAGMKAIWVPDPRDTAILPNAIRLSSLKDFTLDLLS